MRRTLLAVAAVLTMTMTGGQAFAAATPGPVTGPITATGVTVGGEVGAPQQYSVADIAALPQLTLPLGRGPGPTRTVSGASLEALVTAADPVLPSGKNTQLRESITVTGANGRSVTVALGELDPGFGNHPAVLTADRRGHLTLVIPGDATRLRSVAEVRSISVAVSAATTATPTAAGSVQVRAGSRVVELTARRLATLPRRTLTVSFLAGTAPQTHTETGPSLFWVLLAAGILAGPDTVVTAVGGDSYGASVTEGEASLGGRPLLVSLAEDGAPLAQPRLIADGDGKGGRDVAGVVVLAVTRPGR